MYLDEKSQAYLGDWYLLGLGGGMQSTECHFSIGIEYVLIDLRLLCFLLELYVRPASPCCSGCTEERPCPRSTARSSSCFCRG